jgi:hypothetical protein
MTDLNDALDVMTSTYLPFDLVVRGMVLDAQEVEEALIGVEPDSVEQTALQFLATRFPNNESTE